MGSKEYLFLFLVSVFISSCSQVLLKKSADKKYPDKIREIINPIVIFAYGCFFLSSLLTMISYRGVELSAGPILEATGYIYVLILSRIFLKENITFRKTIGISLIILGIFISTI